MSPGAVHPKSRLWCRDTEARTAAENLREAFLDLYDLAAHDDPRLGSLV